jgi:signal transduction protein with GAF and PtsI domain
METPPERKFYLRQFKAISNAISNYEDLPVLFNHLVEGFSRAFKIKGCSLLLYDEQEKQLFHVSSFGISEAYLEKGPVFYDETQCAFVKGEPVFVDDLKTDPRVQYPEAGLEEGFTSMASFPIKCRENILGIIRLYHGDRIVLHADDQESILVLLRQLGLVVEYNGLKNFLDMVKGAMSNLPLRMLKGF